MNKELDFNERKLGKEPLELRSGLLHEFCSLLQTLLLMCAVRFV